ncbi:MAG: protein translocase subunit SecF [Halapricum sp.]
MLEFDVPEIEYDRYSNRQLAVPPLIVLGIAILMLALHYLVNGTPVPLGFDFTGGTEMRLATDGGREAIRQAFGAEINTIRPVQGGDEFIVTFLQDGTSQQNLIDMADDAEGITRLRTDTRSATFGGENQRNALFGLAIAFVGMSVFVFAIFRTFVPSIAIVISAFSDIVIPMGMVAFLSLTGIAEINLTLGTVAALLMLIGYSVDSDILLNNHILRRRGGFYESTYNAMQTGVTMTLTSIVAMIVMTIIALLLSIPLLPDIGIILVFGLTADLMNTYMLNLSLLRWYKFEGVAR